MTDININEVLYDFTKKFSQFTSKTQDYIKPMILDIILAGFGISRQYNRFEYVKSSEVGNSVLALVRHIIYETVKDDAAKVVQQYLLDDKINYKNLRQLFIDTYKSQYANAFTAELDRLIREHENNIKCQYEDEAKTYMQNIKTIFGPMINALKADSIKNVDIK